jgi:3,4-dihydroxy 2-butanone 4-phosphate synthase / GTP cyclohydrolase II
MGTAGLPSRSLMCCPAPVTHAVTRPKPNTSHCRVVYVSGNVDFYGKIIREQNIPTPHGVLSSRLYRHSRGTVGMALWVGDLGGGEPVLSRVHSSCFTSEGLCALDCDCVAQLDFAIDVICREKRGVIFYLLQEGRGAGLPNKARDRSIVQQSYGEVDTYGAYAQLGLPPDPRTYDVIKPMCTDLGIVAPLTLMTNNPEKIGALTSVGLDVVAIENVQKASRYNAQYIAAKKKFGHLLTAPEVSEATLPPMSFVGTPHAERLGRFVWAASYLLPINVNGGPAWFRATSYIDDVSGHDRMILSHKVRVTSEVRHVFREQLEARIGEDGCEAMRYRDALARIVGRGAGAILAVPADPALLIDKTGPSEEDDLELLHADGLARGAETYEEVA